MIDFCDVYLFRLIASAAFIEIVSGSLTGGIFVILLYGEIMTEFLCCHFFLDITTHAAGIFLVTVSRASSSCVLSHFVIMVHFCKFLLIRITTHGTSILLVTVVLAGSFHCFS